MSTHIEGRSNITSGKNIAERVEELDWQCILHDLDVQGSAIIEHLITSAECDTLAHLYPQDRIFRSQVLMAQHGFGRGEHNDFSYPLPDLINDLQDNHLPCLTHSQLLELCNGYRRSLP